jgi:hypothetical protein
MPSTPRTVSVSEARQLLADGAQLVDVLPEESYLQEHLPGAVNVPGEGLLDDGQRSGAASRVDVPGSVPRRRCRTWRTGSARGS